MRGLKNAVLLATIVYVIALLFAGCSSEPPPPTLTTNTIPTGGGSVSPSDGSYSKGVSVNVTATANSGYRFDHWEAGASGNSPTVQITMDSSKKLTAYFTKTYSLSAMPSPSNGGTVSPGSGTYDSGKQVTLIATPAQYYKFNGWSGDASGSSDHLTITMDSDKQIGASFVKLTYSLQAQVDSSGGGTVSPTSGTFEAGTQTTVTATAANGYRFYQWGGDASGSANPLNLLIDKDKHVTAYFIKLWSLSVSSSPSDGGTVTVAPKAGSYDADSRVNISATPSFPNYFKNWIGADNNSVNPTTVTMKSDTSVTAVFAPLPIRKQQTVTGDVHGPGFSGGHQIEPIPIQLNQNEWVQLSFTTGTNPPVYVNIKDPAGNVVKDFGAPGQANFTFLAQLTGPYTITFQNSQDYSSGPFTLTYTIYGFQQ